MKAILILAAATIAVPALAQTTVGVRPSVAHSQPTCVTDGTCPTLAATVSRQLGTPVPVVATPAVGGPYEATAVTRAPMPAPTVGAYPPCSPGPGDDRCIQLYERGRTR
jgi:hypothetical protein